jgi:hypothetical protein
MDLIDAIKAIDKPHEDDVLNRLYTPWGEKIDPDNLLKEYPRPQFVRDSYINLNGYWDYSFTPDSVEEIPSEFEGIILVPFSPESMLSGVERRLEPDQFLWYKKTLPAIAKKISRLKDPPSLWSSGSVCRHIHKRRSRRIPRRRLSSIYSGYH